MRILVSGGRDFNNKEWLYEILDIFEPTLIISGCANGADSLAIEYAEDNNIPLLLFQPEWDKYGRAAGVIRNGDMLEAHPDLVIAFPGGPGTADMVRQAAKARVPVINLVGAI